MKKVILYLLIFLFLGVGYVSAQDLTLSVSSESGLPGDKITVQVIAVSTLTDFTTVSGSIVFDPNVLEYESLNFNNSLYTGFPFNVAGAPGNGNVPLNTITFTILDGLSSFSLAGNPVLFEIEFTIDQIATIGTVTPITIDDSETDLFYSANSGTGNIPSVTAGSVTVGVTSFPVEMLGFEGKMVDANEVQLAWSTASELDNAYFEVQKSANGRDFRAIGEVAGAGTTNEVQSYTFEDRSAMVASNFYRLKQVDFNGTFSYSDIVEIRADGFFNQLSLFPNPAQNQLSVGLIAADMQAAYDLVVRDITGVIVEQKRVAAGAFSDRQQLDLSRMPRGVYYLELIRNDGQKYSSRFVKE